MSLEKKCSAFYGVGINSRRTKHCYWGGLHAEIDALRKIKNTSKRTKRVNIAVFRINKSGDFCNSKPCSNCIKRMEKLQEYKNVKIDKIYYSITKIEMLKISLNGIKDLPQHKSLAFRKQ